MSSRYHRRNRATPRVFSTSAIARLRRRPPPPIRLAISRPWRPVFADPARGAPRFKNPFPRFRVAGRIGLLLSSSPPSEIHPDTPTVTFPGPNYTDSHSGVSDCLRSGFGALHTHNSLFRENFNDCARIRTCGPKSSMPCEFTRIRNPVCRHMHCSFCRGEEIWVTLV